MHALQSCEPLLLALHDLALLVLAGFPPKCAEAFTRLKQQLQQEALQEVHTGLSQSGECGYTNSPAIGVQPRGSRRCCDGCHHKLAIQTKAMLLCVPVHCSSAAGMHNMTLAPRHILAPCTVLYNPYHVLYCTISRVLAGRLLLLHCLLEWGCSAGLVAQLTLPQPSSRAVLLALCWLIAHAQLFDRALQQLQVPHHLLPLLPPYPQVCNAHDEHAAAAAGL
jgi:hypothetical protein